MSLYNSFSARQEGEKMLAASRLRYRILTVLHQALEDSGLTKAELAKKMKVRRSAVGNIFKGDGNLRITTVAEYLHAMDRELVIEVTQRGMPRLEVEAASSGAIVAVSNIVNPGGHKDNDEAVYHASGNTVKVA